MNRFLIAILLCLGIFALANDASAQQQVTVSGYLPAGQTRVFSPRVPNNSLLDTVYYISGSYNISGTLIVMEGAEVYFLPNSRVVDSTGGKIIANGFTGQNRRIKFRGLPVNQNSVEWGHFLVLPGADSVFFANVQFTNFRKRTTVDNTLIYGTTGADLTNSQAINAVANGVGGVMTTFSRRTYIYDALVDSCQASFRGGAFAFLQAPAGFYPAVAGDDGRLALSNSQVRRLQIRDTRVFNQEATDPLTLGGAIYMASNSTSQNTANYLVGYLGNRPGPFFADSTDVMLFERCSANNPNNGGTQFAKGGAIYVGNNTGLILSRGTFNNDSAISPLDLNAWGGAIAVSATSGNPNFGTNITNVPNDQIAGLCVLKTATFAGNVAGLGGAIHMDYMQPTSGNPIPQNPVLNINAENINLSTGVRDSGLIQFNGNIAYLRGGAINTAWKTFITGYLAPQNFPFGNGSRSIEYRVKFYNNVAGQAGGSVCLNTGFVGAPAPNANPDIINRRVWHLQNSVNPLDPRVNRPALRLLVLGGGAEWVGLRDSTFATEYHGNYVIGGNGGAVAINEPQGGAGAAYINRYFVENGFNAQDVTTSPLPTDPRELTRFCDNHAYAGATAGDSTQLQNTEGRGGAIYINITNKTNPILAQDSTYLSRVRIENNYAYTGSAIYSDNYDMKLLANLCLIANNKTTSPASRNVDFDPTVRTSNPSDPNASATIWADFEGALPSYETNSRGNAIYDNMARYILRLPVSSRIGLSGVDTLRGNFWGDTGPNVITQINPPFGAQQNTFFIDYYKGCLGVSQTNPVSYGVYEPNRNPPQGYVPLPIGYVPDTLLMEGRVYDLYDRGTDMKVADYSNRRMAPAEAFALGIPNDVVRIHRFTRDIFSTDPVYVNKIGLYQTDFVGPHPIGYPLFLQADVSAADSNRDDCAKNYTVLMVFNQTTSEFVRVNAKETVADEGNGTVQLYQGRLDFVPDSSVATRHAVSRQRALYTLSLLRPSTMSFSEIQRASKLEDSAALDGRMYTLSAADMMGATAGDSVCTQGINGNTTWFAGERYHTLPVRPGDRILVISRTHLWKYGAAYAIAHGLQFTIGDVLPPQFAGDIPSLTTDPYNPNRRFVREDENYDARDAAHTLFRVAGYDFNNFYDPRFLFNQGNYTQLAINVTPDLLPGDTNASHVRLNSWLKQTTIYNQNVTSSNGYILLSGQPHNPDVVPGGEGVTVTLTNFPPNFGSESGLLNAFDSSVLGANRNMLSMWTFPPYMNCPSGFQADTLCVRPATSTYHFRIYVQDSLPVFTSSPGTACAANLTDSLRYTYDIQTDDESEDSVAQAAGWDFRYGRTSYRFLTRPEWLRTMDNNASFVSKGLINVRMDSNTAVRALTPTPQVNGELNLDTLIAVEVHDGHTGKAVQKWRIPVNVAPVITTTALPDAKEGIDYSLNFRDTTKVNRIQITDPNFADYHTYKLVYLGETDTVYRDAHYQVGQQVLTGTTPLWLKIDPFSGVLTGTPGMNDAPHNSNVTSCGGPDQVMVVVTDQCGLQAWKSFQLNVDSTNHVPSFYRGPHSLCVTNGQDFCDSVRVTDKDLLRTGNCADKLTVTVLEPSTIHVTPSTIQGPASDTTMLSVCGNFVVDDNYFNVNPPAPKYIRLQVTDLAGNMDTLTYAVHIGDIPTFECAVDISNIGTSTHPTDIQHLCFGAGRFGTDSLDARYCEYEVPPAGPVAVFDARWELPIGGQIKGTYVDIRRDTNQFASVTWQARINAGQESGSNLYPLTICWSKKCLDTIANVNFQQGNFYLRHPQTPSEFSINMRTGQGPIDNSLYTLMPKGPDSLCLIVRDIHLANALIVFEPKNSGVETPQSAAPEFALLQNTPNPFNPSTTINFTVGKRSNVRIDIFDMKGALVRTLVNEELEAGSYPYNWDATDASGQVMPSGSYIAKMTADGFTSSIKMTLNK